MHYILDGSSIFSRESLHRALSETLHFPEWYGANLDALYDCLTCISDPTELEIRGCAKLTRALGDYMERLRQVINRCAAENPSFSVVWDDAPDYGKDS